MEYYSAPTLPVHCAPLYHQSQYHGIKMIGWNPPPQDWLKINTDGSWKPSGVATAAGVVRDSFGNWISGFAINLPECPSPLVAELCAILGGLHLSQDLHFTNIIMERYISKVL